MDLTKKYLINGPNNVIRLTNNEKVLYIFADIHIDIKYQNECPINDKYDSIDFDKLLFLFIKKEKIKKYDLFVEIDQPYFKREKNNTFRYTYINQIRKLFKSIIQIKDNKMTINKKYPNFRFHYSDIRDTIDANDYFFDSYCNFTYPFPCSLFALNQIIDKTDEAILILFNLITDIKNSDNMHIKKILSKYRNKNNQAKIKLIIKDILIKNTYDTIKNLARLITFIKTSIIKLKKITIDKITIIDINAQIFKMFTTCKSNAYMTYVLLTDLFFIRRFIDKQYITNCILYTGSNHMYNIMYLLVKYFDFTVSNVYYMHIDFKLNKISKLKSTNYNYIDILNKYFCNYNRMLEFNQCVHLIDFPSNFK